MFQLTIETSNTFRGLVWVTLDQKNPLGALFTSLAILWISFSRLEDIGRGFGSSWLAFWT